jgi:hypothetical protein
MTVGTKPASDLTIAPGRRAAPCGIRACTEQWNEVAGRVFSRYARYVMSEERKCGYSRAVLRAVRQPSCLR